MNMQQAPESLGMAEQAGGILDSFLPDPQAVWQKYQRIRQKSGQTATEKIVNNLIMQTALTTGVVGAVTSVGGLLTMVVMLPADLAIGTRLEAELVYLLAFAHGVAPDDPDLRMMAYWVLAGETAKSAGRLTGEAALEYLTKTKGTDLAISGAKEVGKDVAFRSGGKVSKMFGKIGKTAGRKAAHGATKKAARKAGTKVFAKIIPKGISKVLPVVGAAIGFVVNFGATQAIGNLAAKWFRELPDFYAEIDQASYRIDHEMAAIYGTSVPSGGAYLGGTMPPSIPPSASTGGSSGGSAYD